MGKLVVYDEIGRFHQRGDGRDVGGVPTDKAERGLSLVEVGERALELAVEHTLAGDDAARRDRGAVLVDRGLGGLRYDGVAVEADVVVGGEVEVFAPVDEDLGAEAIFMAAVEGVGEIEALGHFAVLDHRSVAGEVAEAAGGLVNAAQELLDLKPLPSGSNGRGGIVQHRGGVQADHGQCPSERSPRLNSQVTPIHIRLTHIQGADPPVDVC